jgi:hypothetical protein
MQKELQVGDWVYYKDESEFGYDVARVGRITLICDRGQEAVIERFVFRLFPCSRLVGTHNILGKAQDNRIFGRGNA